MATSIKPLDWDSQLFGRRVGCLELRAEGGLDLLLQQAERDGYDLLYAFSSTAIGCVDAGPFTLLDVGGHITFVREIGGQGVRDEAKQRCIEEYLPATPSSELRKMAYRSGHLSRFRVDPLLADEYFTRIYDAWLARTIKARPNAGIYITRQHNRIAGMVSAEWSEGKGKIGLLSVKPSCQGQGLATTLINHLLTVLAGSMANSVEVKTQLTNTGARALYIKNGFTEKERAFVYHLHRTQAVKASQLSTPTL